MLTHRRARWIAAAVAARVERRETCMMVFSPAQWISANVDPV